MKKLSFFILFFCVLSGIFFMMTSTIDSEDETDAPWCLLSPEEIAIKKQSLGQLSYDVTQKDGTERPFENLYWDSKDEGIYVDVVSGEPLFSSIDKFDSGTGWPSFSRALASHLILEKTDSSLGMTRTEVRTKKASSHLGHVFEDGPAPTGKRYCINSAALKFIPKDQLIVLGYAEYLPLFDQRYEIAYLASGCFWGAQDLFRQLEGVIQTRVGYMGGSSLDPVYDQVKTGQTGHAESVQVVFDSTVISYEEILIFFFKMHDPTTLDQQGNDIGSQYRSAIFYVNDNQLNQARDIIARANQSGGFEKPVVTQLEIAATFYLAEYYHQDYLEKNPNGYTCHFVRDGVVF